VRVFELVGEEPLEAGPAARLARFEAALAAYRAGDFPAALTRFEALHEEDPGDHPVAIYLERCRERRAAACEAGDRAAPPARTRPTPV